ncbi:COG4315 family predicted lipoprotein [Streptomyces flaveolus]|uniref:COG4315 family predicted lipoprotein n=1 Tax=Streptomyces flaveolus TaxID=67297 RepID=UPI0033F71FFC
MRTRSLVLAATAVTTALFTLTACSGGGDDAEKEDDGGTAGKAASAVSVKLADSEYGRILVDQEGRTLYAFAKDKDGSSACDVQCGQVWPALTSASDPKPGSGTQKSLLAETERTKGVSQVMYNKWPLYYYVGDAIAGDANGQGIDDEWFVVTADGKLVKKQAG